MHAGGILLYIDTPRFAIICFRSCAVPKPSGAWRQQAEMLSECLTDWQRPKSLEKIPLHPHRQALLPSCYSAAGPIELTRGKAAGRDCAPVSSARNHSRISEHNDVTPAPAKDAG